MNDKEPQLGLQLYWYDIESYEEAHTWWGQLAGGMYRLVIIREELESLYKQREVESALRRLETYVELYLLRAYDLRERALGLIESRTQQKKDVLKLRHPDKRHDALSRLKLGDQKLAESVENLLLLLDDDIGLRNLHTHEQYLTIGLYTGSDIYDPYDALVDVSEVPAKRRMLEALLRREVKKTARRYICKVDAVLEAVRKVLDAGDPASSTLCRDA